MKIKDYALIALILFFAGWMAKEKIARARESRAHEAAKVELREQVQRLTDAKQETTIVYDTVFKVVERVRRVPVAVDSAKIAEIYRDVNDDWVFVSDTLEVWEREFADTLTTADFSLPYRIGLTGELNFVDFASYELYTESKIVNHIVEKPVIKYNEKSHIYAYAMFGNTGKEWTAWESLDVGLQWVHKRGIVLGGGVQWFDGGRFYKLKIGYRLTR